MPVWPFQRFRVGLGLYGLKDFQGLGFVEKLMRFRVKVSVVLEEQQLMQQAP